MTSVLLFAAAGLIAAGATAAYRRVWFGPALVVQAAGAALLCAAGFCALVSGATVGSGFTSAFEPRLGVDGLTAFFLATVGAVAAPALVYARAYLHPDARGRAVAVLCGLFVLVLVEVLCARDPLTFLVGWELMTLMPAATILVARPDETSRHTVFLYVAATHLAGAGTWIAVLLLAHAGAIGGAPVVQGSSLQIAIALAALVGMGTKAGLVPFHSWLPRAHPIAPAPVSALNGSNYARLVEVKSRWDSSNLFRANKNVAPA